MTQISSPLKIGINGFGRIGRLVFRILTESSKLQVMQVNDPGGDANTFAHLLNFDSIHGRWGHQAVAKSTTTFEVAQQQVKLSGNKNIADTDWSECDLVIESSGFFRKREALQAYLDQGVQQVLVSAPMSDDTLNIVLGVNHEQYVPNSHASNSHASNSHNIVTAASCTTNCLGPIVQVILKNFGIKHASMTTIHSATNDQVLIDSPHKDLRRARATGSSLIPTTTGSAQAITEIFPQLKGKINGHAVRVPLTNASLTDIVFEVEQSTSVAAVNEALTQAAQGLLKGILNVENRPLVSVDYATDPHSATIDTEFTMVVDGTQVKIFAWYDNEWGYSNRVAELAQYIAAEKFNIQ